MRNMFVLWLLSPDCLVLFTFSTNTLRWMHVFVVDHCCHLTSTGWMLTFNEPVCVTCLNSYVLKMLLKHQFGLLIYVCGFMLWLHFKGVRPVMITEMCELCFLWWMLTNIGSLFSLMICMLRFTGSDQNKTLNNNNVFVLIGYCYVVHIKYFRNWVDRLSLLLERSNP